MTTELLTPEDLNAKLVTMRENGNDVDVYDAGNSVEVTNPQGKVCMKARYRSAYQDFFVMNLDV